MDSFGTPYTTSKVKLEYTEQATHELNLIACTHTSFFFCGDFALLTAEKPQGAKWVKRELLFGTKRL
jgi:hypothetical protein